MIDNLRDQLAATREQLTNARSANLANSIIADNAAQTQTLISSLLPRPVPAYPSASPYMAYNWSNYFNNGGCPYNNIQIIYYLKGFKFVLICLMIFCKYFFEIFF